MAITDRIESMYNHTGEAYAIVEEKGGNVLNPLSHNLPDEYQEVDYIESHGTEYIDTGRVGLNGDDIEAKINTNGNVGALYGSISSNSNRYHVYVVSEGVNIGWGDLTRVPLLEIDINQILNIKAHLENANQIIEVNNLKATATRDFGTKCYGNATIFVRNSPVESVMKSSFLKTQLYNLKISNSGEVVFNFIPCYRKNDNEIGLYDLVTGTFFGNAGTGAFTYGSIVEQNIDKNLENLSSAISTIDTHTEELEEMRTEMQKPALNTFSKVDGTTAYTEYPNALKDYSGALQKYMEYNSDTVEGVSEVKLENAMATNALQMSLKGNILQEAYEGYNILDESKILNTSSSGVAFTNIDGKVVVNGTSTKTIDKYISDNTGILDIINASVDGTKWNFYIKCQKSDITLTPFFRYKDSTDAVKYNATYTKQSGYSATGVFFRIPTNVTFDNETLDIMIYSGTVTKEYEPYTGGIPAPNPDYPMPIQTLDDARVEINGKNLFNDNLVDKSSYTSQGITTTWDGTKIHFEGTCTSSYTNITRYADIPLKKGTYTISIPTPLTHSVKMKGEYDDATGFEFVILKDTSSITFTIEKNISRWFLSIAGVSAGRVLNGTITFQLEKGTQATPYTPYIEPKEVDLPLQGNELTSNDTLQIGFDGNAFIEKKWGKLVLTGDESWRILNKTFFCEIQWGRPNSMCSHFSDNGRGWLSSDETLRGKYTATNADNQFKCMPLTDITLDQFKSWLKSLYNEGNPVTIYYELTSPSTIELQNTPIPLLPDTNNVSVNGNIEPSGTGVRYAVNIFADSAKGIAEVVDYE